MGQKLMRVLLFSGQPFDTNRVLCCIEKLCGGTGTAPHSAHPPFTLSSARKRKIYESEKRKFIGQTTITLPLCQIKTTARTVKTGKNRGVFVTRASEIFWRPQRDNLHWRQDFVAKRPTRDL